MSVETKRHPVILDRKKTALLIIDVQERILGVMRNHEELIENILKLIRGAKILNIPIYYTEQYPKGLGPTAQVLLDELEGNEAVQKMSFSCQGAGDLFKELAAKNLTQIVVAGIESHVCVQQTALDLLANGFQVDIPADAVSSRREFDFITAMNRLNKHGAEVTTAEVVLFELLEVCGTPEFKAVSKLVK